MNDQTYEALKRLLDHATNGGPNDAQFWNDIRSLEMWIDEAAKEYQGKKWSECNHIATNKKGSCVRCGYNTLGLTMKQYQSLA